MVKTLQLDPVRVPTISQEALWAIQRASSRCINDGSRLPDRLSLVERMDEEDYVSLYPGYTDEDPFRDPTGQEEYQLWVLTQQPNAPTWRRPRQEARRRSDHQMEV